MNGSPPPPLRPHHLPLPLTASHHRLRHYNQQRLLWSHRTNCTLSKLQSFLQQRRAQAPAEWLQKCFGGSQGRRQLNELTDYYRYYHNCPILASPKYQELMNHYWQKTKALYYRKIKRELQLTDGTSQYSLDQPIQQSAEKISYLKATFQLPSHLKHSRHSLLLSFHHDPDATLRRLIDALNYKKQLKQQTREATKIVEENPLRLQQNIIKVQTYQNTGKSHPKTHLRTNPSHLVSTSSFKKTKKKTQHKSLSNQPQKHSPHVYKEKKLNTMGSCQKIGVKQPQSTLNYQRRNKHPKGQKISKNINSNTHNPNNIHKVIISRQINNDQKQHANHVRTKQGSMKKAKSKQKSQKKNIVKRISVSKFKQVEKKNVKAAIDRAKVKIKAQKNMAMKKYIESSHSCNKSAESLQPEYRHSKK